VTASAPELPRALREAWRSLEARPHIRPAGEVRWDRRERVWVLPVEAVLQVPAGNGVPDITTWFVHVSPRYPWGDIAIFPAKVGGVVGTYPHQDHNSDGPPDRPWREGDVCVKEPTFALGRSGSDPDPKGDPERLLWYADRLSEWLRRAASGTLIATVDPFELPQFRESAERIIGWWEDEDSFSRWRGVEDRVGIAELVSLGNPWPLVVKKWNSANGRELFAPAWGTVVEKNGDAVLRVAWIRAQKLPIVAPYAAPMTWGELRSAFDESGEELDRLLKPIVGAVRSVATKVLLVGFPVPRRVGDSICRMHWQPLSLDELSTGREKGFRNNNESLWKRDRMLSLGDSRKLAWLRGRNWAPGELATRGQLCPQLRGRKVIVLGAGAVGSAVGELLVRGGLTELTIVDDDSLEAGNLSRHTLGLASIGGRKAIALAARLSYASPHLRVSAIVGTYPDLPESQLEELRGADLFVDCSGENDAIHALMESQHAEARDFASIALGRAGARGYTYLARARQFPADRFWEELEPHAARDRAEHGSDEEVWEGTGCWSPVFPAPAHVIWQCAAAAVAELDLWYRNGRVDGGLRVFEPRGLVLDAKPEFAI
jgi:molybdopterin/thiamine biosynthesis adenylyltransferase